MRRWFSLWVLASALWAGLAQAQSQTDQEDVWLQETIQKVLARRGYESLEVRAKGGVVTVTGRVRSARDKILIIQAAFTVAEVEAIETDLQLRVSGTPQLEEEIWLTLFQEGLGGELEEIIVENGVAEVSGRAPDEATRDKVFAIVRRVPGVEAVTSALIIADAAPKTPEPARTAIATTPKPSPEREPAPLPEPESELEPERKPEPVPEPEPVPVPELEPEPEPEPEPVPEPEPEPEPEAQPEPVLAPVSEPEPEPNSEAAPARNVAPARSETDIARDIAQRILSADYTVFDHIQFGFDEGVVEIEGSLTTREKKDALENSIANISGVVSVRSDIRVQSDSSADQRLRRNLFRRIYDDPSFAEFADKPNPPVHIVVDGKHVTLTGAVDTLIQQMAAEAIVRTTFGVLSVKNRIRVRE